ncbi:nucleotidyl transferase AbiEii/AbiGii toxin family protein [Bdellovibrio bacteriovorus]|uniref:nucleotidyl transferase AbiEii/AbiGii toxin family protein n=1 Tax=Bdellovibrio bacteriovorus TaxID=959 RepID=UPI003D079DFA
MNLQALKDRIKVIGKEKGLSAPEVWNQLAFERFLARLAKSEHHDKFIFKGGLLLSQYISIGRETVDLDFLVKNMQVSAKVIEDALAEIAAIDLGDSFKFEYDSIEQLDQPHMEYDGFRVKLKMSYETMTDKVQIDIGVGDIVDPNEMDYQTFSFKGVPLFSDSISIQVYPLETILAEKLETIVSKGAINSRMKDYHDALLIIRSGHLPEGSEVKSAVEATFSNRKTDLQFPISFDEDETRGLQRLWAAHLKKLGARAKALGLPEEIQVVISDLNKWVAAALK